MGANDANGIALIHDYSSEFIIGNTHSALTNQIILVTNTITTHGITLHYLVEHQIFDCTEMEQKLELQQV